ncbi:MAG: HlyC/CorC family transporter [Lachnospiraceae bacterium]|nr:HlyC/CorC family transporter [Lachnospiraceae bacterium]
MESSVVFTILLQIILIMLNAVFACAEIAVISMNDNKLAKMAAEGDKRALRLVRLTNEPARFLATIQVAITLSGFLGSAFAAENFSGVIVDTLVGMGVPISVEVLDSIAVVLITIILSYFTLVFGELVPKQVAMRKAEPLALLLSSLISNIARIFAPLVSFLTFSTNTVLRLFGIDPNMEEDHVSEEEIRMMIDVGSEKGTIDYEERAFIQNVFEFDDLSAQEIITHRTDVMMVDINDSGEDWKDIIYSSRHTLYPVCDGTADRIVGILNAKDYFRMEDKSKENILQKAVKPPYFVPDTVKADRLFKNMRKGHHSMAIVFDEYGGMSGIITINDLVEQLVGELGEETNEEEDVPIRMLDDHSWEIQGNAWLDEVARELGISLNDEEFDTFSGFVLHQMGSIPEDGAVIEMETSALHISGAKIVNHQVETARVCLKQNEEK